MKCPKCQHEVPEADSKFCNRCGCGLTTCAEPDDSTYSTPHSYTPKHLADKILKTKSSIIGERKYVTVLFADVAEYTKMSEKLDPEDVHQIMDGCFKILMDEIHQYKGTINQFTGDGVMALFGAPLALEDHAQDACRASLSIQKAVKGYGKELQNRYGIKFQMRIGINSGAVVVGSIGDDLRMDYTAIGDTTNLAARMECLARPGTVLVSPGTYGKVRDQFELKAVGEIKVKGKELPIEAYKLIKDKVFRPRIGFERQIYSEMVGRDRELNLLELQVSKAVNGEGSVVNVIGEAGIGKSRLIAELKSRDVVKRVALLEGRAISIGRNLSFHPIIDLLKHWARIGEDDTEAVSLGKLEKAVRGVTQQDAEEIIPFVATLMGMKVSGRYAERLKGIEGDSLEKLILKNVKDLITKAAEQIPLVVVIEDLHWADDSSIELLESLFRLANTNRILFINVFRPGYEESGVRIIESIKERFSVYYVEIKLEPLSEQMSEALIDNMLDIKGLHHGIRSRVIQRSGGNPFFIEEVVRSFIDEGAVVAKDGKFEVTDKIEKVIIPHTINDVLMARIDRLEDETRELVKVASVIGRSFFHKILAEVADSVRDINGKISHLKEIQLIRERSRMEELEYLFKHALAQEAAYESILHKKRKELHLQVAKSIESVYKERLHEFYGMLALHYNKGEDEERAEEYLIKAGEEAIKSSASSEAIQYYQEALNLYLKKYDPASDPEKVAMLESKIGIALFNRGQYLEAVQFLDKSIEFYEGGLPKNIFLTAVKFCVSFLNFIISLYFPPLKFKKTPMKSDLEALNLVYKKLNALAITNPKRFFIESFYFLKRLSNFNLTKVSNSVGMYGGASGTFSWPGVSFILSRKVLDFVGNKADMSDVKSKVQYNMVLSLYSFVTGHWDMAKEYDNKLVSQALHKGEFFNTSVYIIFQGFIQIDRGCFKDVQLMVDKLSEIVDVYENIFSKGHKFEVGLKLLLKQRKFHDMLDEIDKGIDFGNRTGLNTYACVCYIYKARIQLLTNDIKGAEESLSHIEEYKFETLSIPYYQSSYLLNLFLLNLLRLEEMIIEGNTSQAKRIKNESLKIGKKVLRTSRKAASERTETLRLIGTYYWLINKQKKAIKWWSRSIVKGEKLGARVELSRTYMEVGKRLLSPNSEYREFNSITAQGYVDKARTMFQEMDLQYDLDELDKIVASN